MSRTPLASTATTFGCVSLTSGSILCAICAALAKKIGPSGLSSRRPGKLSSSGCSGDRGRNTLVPGLRRRTYTGGSATWYASVTRETMMATMIPFRVPTTTTPANATIAHENSVLRMLRIARNSIGLMSPKEYTITIFERFLISQGIILLKYWLEVSVMGFCTQEEHREFLRDCP